MGLERISFRVIHLLSTAVIPIEVVRSTLVSATLFRMRFLSLDGTRSKRSIEPHVIDMRPLKKTSPTPSMMGDVEAMDEGKSGLATPQASPVRADVPNSADRLTIALPATPTRAPGKLVKDFADLLVLQQSSPTPRGHRKRVHPIFQIPDVLETILGYVAGSGPEERSCSRRRPLSYEHALLIYKDERKAQKVWRQSARESTKVEGSLFSCLLVNKLWHSITLRCLLQNVHFKDCRRLVAFAKNRSGAVAYPSSFVLHKLQRLTQAELDQVGEVISPRNLKWLDMYICPYVLPPVRWIPDLHRLEKLILPGNKVINDEFLLQLSQYVPNLKNLDLRACDNVSDSGIIAIALKCRKLQMCNIGRHRNGDKITSLSVASLAENTQIETLGIAGCQVDDAGIWVLAQSRGKHITRLSLNNCSLLTNHSIPLLLAFNYLPNLAVLEVRNIDRITEVRTLVDFKLWKKSQKLPVLIEGCERLTKLMSEEENRVSLAFSIIAQNST